MSKLRIVVTAGVGLAQVLAASGQEAKVTGERATRATNALLVDVLSDLQDVASRAVAIGKAARNMRAMKSVVGSSEAHRLRRKYLSPMGVLHASCRVLHGLRAEEALQ